MLGIARPPVRGDASAPSRSSAIQASVESGDLVAAPLLRGMQRSDGTVDGIDAAGAAQFAQRDGDGHAQAGRDGAPVVCRDGGA